ncbi:MAG: S8 family serine peptidase [Bacillota bacterium]|nr:S8 family serine peptidase [Bacillota bacterium]
MNKNKTFKKLLIAALFFVGFHGALVLGLADANAEGAEKPSILVKYKDSPQTMAIGLDSRNDKLLELDDKLGKLGIVKVFASEDQVLEDIVKTYASDPHVEYAEPNYLRTASGVLPSDPYFLEQWALEKINMPGGWSITSGNDEIIVAVIDSGVDLDNEEFSGRLVEGYNYYDNNAIPQDDSVEGHGTFVTSIIAANANNQIGMAGVMWQGKIMPLKVLNSQGHGYDSDIAAAILDAADKGARIINISLGGPEPSNTLLEAINYAHSKGVVIVAASGNASLDSVYYPAAYPNVIAVGAVTQYDLVAGYSNYGPQLNIVAPGTDVHGLAVGTQEVITGSGTSYAAPYVTGVVALLLALHPGLTPEQVQVMIEGSALDIGDAGWDLYTGNGRLDALGALTKEIPVFHEFKSNDSSGMATDASVGSINGYLDYSNDKDWYQVYLEGDQSYTIEAAGSHEFTMELEVYDAEGLLIDAVSISPFVNIEINNAREGYYRIVVKEKFGRWLNEPYGLQLKVASLNIDPNYGDFNGDSRVDIYDLVILSRRIGLTKYDIGYDAIYDGNRDEVLDIQDLRLAAKNRR